LTPRSVDSSSAASSVSTHNNPGRTHNGPTP
jgi:hypothetical protein